MPFKSRRRQKRITRKKQTKGLDRRAREARAEALQEEWENLLLSDRAAKQTLSKISRDSAEGFQIPRSDYEVGHQLHDLYKLIHRMSKEDRATLLTELSAIYPGRKGASKYHALVRAGSISGYNNKKVISQCARKLENAIKAKVPLEEFDDFRTK
ncbi:hypothetical protein [Bradyrhizobium sp. WSM4349]|uniref:hypothetical protein n=1 Tax=Bradyrhizobium sp. WSM4349 TaxID=1040988 RepID=UPI00037947D8|nr:hypothetical protein [Bradyrhizobium sp. WSM4349]